MDLKLLQIRRACDRLIFIMRVLHLDRRCLYWEGAHCEWYPPCRGYIYHIYIHDDVKKNTYTGCNLGRLLHSLSLVVVGRDVRRMGQSIKLTGVLCFRDLKIDWKKPNLKWILGTLQCGVGSPDRPGEFQPFLKGVWQSLAQFHSINACRRGCASRTALTAGIYTVKQSTLSRERGNLIYPIASPSVFRVVADVLSRVYIYMHRRTHKFKERPMCIKRTFLEYNDM